MELICIERRAWESLKEHVGLLTREVEAMENKYHSKQSERWLDSADVCQILNLSKRTLQSYRVRGIIPFTMLGGKVYFRESDIVDILKSDSKKR